MNDEPQRPGLPEGGVDRRTALQLMAGLGGLFAALPAGAATEVRANPSCGPRLTRS